MPKNVMKLIKPSPHRARNDFDLSHRHLYSINFGELLPSTCIDVVPGDHIRLRASDLMRAIPMVTSPFLRAKQHLDVWFVPYSDLWHNFNQFIVQKREPLSSALRFSSFCPHFNIGDAYRAVTGNGSSATITNDMVGRPYLDGAKKIWDLLGYGMFTEGTYSVNPWRLLAYNKIWYDEYRQQYYDDGMFGLSDFSGELPFNNEIGASYLFNVDDMQCNSVVTSDMMNRLSADVGSVGNQRLLAAMFQMRYRCWKKDLFTGLLPSTQFGAVSTVPLDATLDVTYLNTFKLKTPYQNPNYNSFLYLNHLTGMVGYKESSAGTDTPPDAQFNMIGTDNLQKYIVSNVSAQGIQGFDILALRKSEAVQIWRENALRAGNRVKDNMTAHYGVEPRTPRDHRATYLGSVSAPINIGDVTSTAQTGDSTNGVLGDVAGKGLSSFDDKVFDFDSKDFGVIMVMHSVLPEAEYNSTGIDRMNQLIECEDYFIPEYENLGFEPVQRVDFRSDLTNQVMGYAPRYIGYKQKLDKVFGEFRNYGDNVGMFAPWASPNFRNFQIITGDGSLSKSAFYVAPQTYNINFVVGVSQSDQFLVDMYFDVDAVRPMSVLGLPFS